jgi:plasmid stabilization system protein ParE
MKTAQRLVAQGLLLCTPAALVAGAFSLAPVGAQTPAAAQAPAVEHTIYFWRENAELDSVKTPEITQLKFATLAYRRPNRPAPTRVALYEFHSIDFATTPDAARLAAARIGKLASAPPSERLAALGTAAAEIEKELAKTTDAFGKASGQLALARVYLDLAGLSKDGERAARADQGLTAIAPLLADKDSWFFTQATPLAVDLHIAKDNAKDALAAAKALVDAADAAGDPGKLLRVEARLLHSRAALAADAAASARDSAKEAADIAVAETPFFVAKKDQGGVVKRLAILERQAVIWQGYGILAQNPKQAQGYFKGLLDKLPQTPEARRQKDGNPTRVLSADAYGKGLWPGSELWAYATLGRAEADYLVAKEANRKPDMELAIEGFLQGLAVAPEVPELLARAKVRLAECLSDARGKNAEALAKSFLAEVADYHPTAAAAKIARAKR